MSFTDPIGDMITRIRNGQMRSYVKIEMPASSFKGKILEILKREGFILNYSLDQTNEKKTKFSINLKYNSGSPVINNIERISKTRKKILFKRSKYSKNTKWFRYSDYFYSQRSNDWYRSKKS